MATIFTEDFIQMRTETMKRIKQRHEEFNREIERIKQCHEEFNREIARIQKENEVKETKNSKMLNEIDKMLEDL